MATLSKRWISSFTILAFLSTSLVPVAPAAAGKTVKHTLGTEVTYAEGVFEHEQDRKSSYTAPHKPQKAPTQSVKIYDGNPKQMPYEKLLIRTLPGKDGRKKVEKTTEWPYLFHAQLSLHFPSGEYGGSGILVGPQHLLTAAHNVYNYETKEWATRITANLGLNDAMVPFGACEAIQIYTFEDWVHKNDSNFDMALITLNQPIGLKVGWCGLLCLNDSDLLSEDVHVTGYPGDKGFKQMWTMSHSVKKVEPERMFYEIDTYPGQSGSGIWINKWGNPYTVGIHTLGEGGKYEGNSGVRLSQRKFTQILTEWISKTRDIQEPILKQPSLIKRRQDTLPDVNNTSKIAKKNEDIFNKSKEPVVSPVKPQPKADVPPIQPYTLKDFQEALKRYQLAADQGHLEAMFNVARFYEKGIGVKQKDETIALKWYQLAANQGHVEAQYQTGLFYEKGKGVKQDINQALVWYQKAAAQGHTAAQQYLTQNLTMVKELLTKGDAFFSTNNFQEALKCYQLATDKGCMEAYAQNRIGFLYSQGEGVKQDYAEAMLWYQKAAAQGYADAQNNIGVLYYYGYGVKQDDTKALAWFQKAAAQGYALAQTNIRLLHEKRFVILPAIVHGYEEIYQRFLKGKLIYHPNKGSDVGKIEMRIAAFANPLEGTFDLSRCGDVGKYLSIATGYCKVKLEQNKDKAEIWLTPRFLIEKELHGVASHFKRIMDRWNASVAPIGIFFTWGNRNDLRHYDYATSTSPDQFTNMSFYNIYSTHVTGRRMALQYMQSYSSNSFNVILSKIFLSF